MTAVNRREMALTPEKLNEMDRWLLDFLNEHEWATPNLMRQFYDDEEADEDEDDGVSRQWVSRRLTRLAEHNHIEHVHPDASEYQLVSDPRETGEE